MGATENRVFVELNAPFKLPGWPVFGKFGRDFENPEYRVSRALPCYLELFQSKKDRRLKCRTPDFPGFPFLGNLNEAIQISRPAGFW